MFKAYIFSLSIHFNKSFWKSLNISFLMFRDLSFTVNKNKATQYL